jgi:EmrB/QacA subfamily drug resistance transporter
MSNLDARSRWLALYVLCLASLMIVLDVTIVNVALPSIRDDLGASFTDLQWVIDAYALSLAALVLTAGSLADRLGRRRVFAIGLGIFSFASLLCALSPDPTFLNLSRALQGVGGAIMFAVSLALLVQEFPAGRERGTAMGIYGASIGAAVAVGPLIGGIATTYFSWRWVFVGEVLIIIPILFESRRIQDAAPEERQHLDLVGATLSALGLGLAVYGVLRSGEWGWLIPKPDAPELFGLSLSIWLILAGFGVLVAFVDWARHLESRGSEPLVRPSIFRNRQLDGGLLMFLFQYLVQMGLFFMIPLFLSVALGLSALETGVRILPLSITLLLGAAGIPRFRPNANPRRVVRFPLLAMFAGIVTLLATIDPEASAKVVTVPLLLAGLGVGALASQLGAVTVSSVPDEESAAVGGLQNTATNLGASIGTALAGSILITALTSSFLTGVTGNPAVPQDLQTQANEQLAAGVPFISDADLEKALADAGVAGPTAAEIVNVNEEARITGLKAGLAVLAALAALTLRGQSCLEDRAEGRRGQSASRTGRVQCLSRAPRFLPCDVCQNRPPHWRESAHSDRNDTRVWTRCLAIFIPMWAGTSMSHTCL